MASLPSDVKVVFYDIETSKYFGGGAWCYEVVQFGAVLGADAYTSFVKPRWPIDPSDYGNQVHGITDEDVRDAPSFAEFFQSFLSWLEPRLGESSLLLVGYNNWSSDDKKLAALLADVKAPFRNRQVFTSDVFRAVTAAEKEMQKKFEGKSLAKMYERHSGKPLKSAHDATADARATRDVSKYYWKFLIARPFADAGLPVPQCKRLYKIPEVPPNWPEDEATSGDEGQVSAEGMEPPAPVLESAASTDAAERHDESLETPRRATKRPREEKGHFHGENLAWFPCLCGRPETCHFPCQCVSALAENIKRIKRLHFP